MQTISGSIDQGGQQKPVEIKIELPTNSYFMSGIRDFTLSLIENMTDFFEPVGLSFPVSS